MALVAGIGLGTFVIIFIILVGLAVIFLGEQTDHPVIVCCVVLIIVVIIVVIFVASPKEVPGQVVVETEVDHTYPTRVGLTIFMGIMAIGAIVMVLVGYTCTALRASRLQADHHPPWTGSGAISSN